jgi:DNA-binding CsgD family transcriptional regulator
LGATLAEPISSQEICDLIGLIYDCAIDPGRWQLVMEAFIKAFNYAQGGLALQSLPSGQYLLVTSAGVEPFWQARQAAYGPDSVNLWGGLARLSQYPLDEPIIHSKIENLTPFQDNRYYVEWLEPQGLSDAVAFMIARDSTMLGSIAWSRHVSAGDLGEHEMTAMRLIAPHFRRAAAISKLLELKTIAAQTFEATLNSLSTGIVLVDESLGIVHANAAAEAMLSSGDPITSRAGKLTTPRQSTLAVLAAVVSQAAKEEQRLGQRGIGIPLQGRNGVPSVVHVLPMGGGDIRPELQRRAKAALFIASANAPPQMPRDALALIYDLTNAESRVFELIVEGKTQGEIARVLGVAVSTVKTHLLHVFGKTGCNRQADLVKMAASLSMPV